MNINIAKPKVAADLERSVPSSFESHQQLEGLRVVDGAISNIEATSLSFDASVIEDMEISASKLHKLTLVDVRLNSCLFFGSDFDGASWRRVSVNAGMFSGAVLSDAKLEDIEFSGVKLNLANFRTSKFKRVRFKDCDITEADFQGAELSEVEFDNCGLEDADFGYATMSRVSFPGCDLGGIKGVSGLRGATIDGFQLMALSPMMAAQLGISVNE